MNTIVGPPERKSWSKQKSIQPAFCSRRAVFWRSATGGGAESDQYRRLSFLKSIDPACETRNKLTATSRDAVSYQEIFFHRD